MSSPLKNKRLKNCTICYFLFLLKINLCNLLGFSKTLHISIINFSYLIYYIGRILYWLSSRIYFVMTHNFNWLKASLTYITYNIIQSKAQKNLLVYVFFFSLILFFFYCGPKCAAKKQTSSSSFCKQIIVCSN